MNISKQSWITENQNSMMHNGRNLITEETYKDLLESEDQGLDMTSRIKPSQINNFKDSAFQNIEMEEFCWAFNNFFLYSNDCFSEINNSNYRINSRTLSESPFIQDLQNNHYIQQLESGNFIITNKFLKAFIKKGIFTLEKSKKEDHRKQSLQLAIMKEQEIYQWVFDAVKQLSIKLRLMENLLEMNPNDPNTIIDINNNWLYLFTNLKEFIEENTGNFLTLEVFGLDWERGCIDVFIKIKWVTFESDPIRDNVSAGYLRWRDSTSLENAINQLLNWIKNSPEEIFNKELKSDLKIFTS